MNARGSRKSRGGYATVVVLALVSLMIVFMVSGQRTLHRMKGELRIMEEKQLRHWIKMGVTTRDVLDQRGKGGTAAGGGTRGEVVAGREEQGR